MLSHFAAIRNFLDQSGHSYMRLFLLVAIPAIFWMGLFGLIGAIRLGREQGVYLLMPPVVSLVILVCSLLLLIARTFPKIKRPAALVVIGAVSFVWTASLLWPAWQAQRLGLINFALALSLIAGFVAYLVRPATGPVAFRPDRSSQITAIAGTFFTVIVSYALVERDTEQLRQLAQSRAEILRDSVGSAVQSSLGVIDRLGARWSKIGGEVSFAYIEQEFQGTFKGFDEFKRLTYLNENLLVLHDTARSHAHADHLEQALVSESFRDYLQHVFESGEAHLAPVGDFVADPDVGLIIAPVFSEGSARRIVVGIVSISEMVGNRLESTDLECCYKVASSGNTLHEVGAESGMRVLASGNSDVTLHHDMRLDTQYLLANSPGRPGLQLLPEAILLFGLLLTFLANSSQRLTHVARRRATQLQHIALHDSLTGLPNRRMLIQQMEMTAERCAQDGSSMSVLFLEVDGLRLISDSIGHEVADSLLIQIAERLRRLLPGDSSLARLDAGEFVICLASLTCLEVESLVQTLIGAVEQPLQVGPHLLRINAYAGITRHSANSVADPMRLVREADLAMLRARRQGHSVWCHYTPEMGYQVTKRLEMYNVLQEAIERGTISLRYQPLIGGKDGSVVSLEVLMRLPHPVLGEVSPGRFIPMAEDTGQIIAMTDWLLVKACQDAELLERAGFGSVPIAVNISPRYFRRADFVERIADALTKAKMHPSRLQVEITESVMLDDQRGAISKLRALRAMGVQSCLDDFGTGYSSLAYLRELPVSVVKIDQAFVRNVISEPADAAIARGVTAMAHHLHLDVVVEGVETLAQFAFLKRINCDVFQGFLFDRPMPIQDLIDKLRQQGLKRSLPEVEPVTTSSAPRRSHSVQTLVLTGDMTWRVRLAGVLRSRGFEVLLAEHGMHTLQYLAQYNIEVVIAQETLTDMTAILLFTKVAEMYPDVVRWLSAQSDQSALLSAPPGTEPLVHKVWGQWPDPEELVQALAARDWSESRPGV